ncbi:MAG: hypothetical protein RR501_11350 [Cloacibacillus sp.]
MTQHPVFKIMCDNEHAAGSPRDGESFFSTADDLLSKVHSVGTVLIEASQGYNEGRYMREIERLRQSPLFCYAPIFLTRSVCGADAVTDGVAPDSTAIPPKADAILARGSKIRLEKLEHSYKLRMLAYIYARGDAYELKPYCVPGSKWIYGYPNASLIVERQSSVSDEAPSLCCDDGSCYSHVYYNDDSISAAYDLLKNLAQKNYLEEKKIYNRIRLCPKCATGHLNYVDTCPQCGSLNMHRKKMLHCFTCGHVAPEENFKQDFSLICPRCATKLRHIGSDYDFPLESFLCSDCGASFVEPAVKVSCLNCGASSEQENLLVRNFYGYSIGEKGTEALMTGVLSEDFMLFDGTNVVNFETFCGLFRWLSILEKRYPDAGFSLLGVRLLGLAEAEEAIGSVRLQKFIAELGRRIKELVRDSDIAAKGPYGAFWVILPRTSIEGGNILADRIKKLESFFDGAGAEHVRISVKCFPTSADDPDTSKEELLARYSKEI